MRPPGAFSLGALAAVLVLLAAGLLAVSGGEAFARAPVFGIARPEPGFSPADWGPLAPLLADIARWQAQLYRLLSGLVRDFAADPAAGPLLIGFSFVYGVLHAAGPGHGKAMISSYLVATGEGARRGVILSFAAAGVQALSAILLVSVLAGLARASSLAMTRASVQLEAASYALIALVGLSLVVRKAAALLALARRRAGAGADDDQAGPDHGHVHGCDCGHDHAVDPQMLARGPLSLRRAALAVAAVGLRPCSGAILVLVFALAQGVYVAGLAAVLAMALGTGVTVAIIATLVLGARDVAARIAGRRSRLAALLFHGAEMAGALLILLAGSVLSVGAVFSL